MTCKTDSDPEIDVYARDLRMIRAAGSVSGKYQIRRRQTPGSATAVFDVSGGTKPYEVTVNPGWQCCPTCTCPDASNRAQEQNGGFCKHIIAVLLQNEEFRHQLLELFL
ncbi:MAG TPA: SWIM zinc finger domain-containing protein [Candidatus Ozemobacteraceae bacterium]|nr:SWIM zinc finger domain-containing protein [Candidatus Ozemobacteraceae bacterium]